MLGASVSPSTTSSFLLLSGQELLVILYGPFPLPLQRGAGRTAVPSDSGTSQPGSQLGLLRGLQVGPACQSPASLQDHGSPSPSSGHPEAPLGSRCWRLQVPQGALPCGSAGPGWTPLSVRLRVPLARRPSPAFMASHCLLGAQELSPGRSQSGWGHHGQGGHILGTTPGSSGSSRALSVLGREPRLALPHSEKPSARDDSPLGPGAATFRLTGSSS